MTQDIWTLLVTEGWGLQMLRGTGMTIVLSVIGMLAGILIAFPLALLHWRRVPVLGPLVTAYSVLVRGIPSLLVIYLIFFGTIQQVERLLSVFGYVSGGGAVEFVMGVLSISVISSAYSIEVFRGALTTVPRGLLEAGWAAGFGEMLVFRRIVFPLAMRAALGGLNNVWQNTLKDSSLISVVGFQEVMRVAALAAGITRSALFFYMLAALAFLMITLLSQAGFGLAERRLERGLARENG